MPPEPTPPQDELADAQAAIGEFGRWINNADSKSGLLAAAVAVLVGAFTQQTDALRIVLRADAPLERFALICLAVSAAAVVATVVALGYAIFPRFKSNPERSRFAYPYVAETAVADLRPGGRGDVVDEAWLQAKILATIAMRKFKAFRLALVTFGTAIIAFLTWTALAALVTG